VEAEADTQATLNRAGQGPFSFIDIQDRLKAQLVLDSHARPAPREDIVLDSQRPGQTRALRQPGRAKIGRGRSKFSFRPTQSRRAKPTLATRRGKFSFRPTLLDLKSSLAERSHPKIWRFRAKNGWRATTEVVFLRTQAKNVSESLVVLDPQGVEAPWVHRKGESLLVLDPHFPLKNAPNGHQNAN